MPSPPARILFLRPDAYGDLILFEPVLRIVRDAWPQAEIVVLIRHPYRDLVPLLGAESVRWLTTACDPYRRAPGDDPAAFEALRAEVCAFAPDCLVAACAEQTWLEAAVGTFLPGARQVALGRAVADPLVRASLEAMLPVDWAALYPEPVATGAGLTEWEKNLLLAGALLGSEAPRWWPLARVPADAGAQAARILAEAGLTPGAFAVCAAAGTANVQIKSWPAAHYGHTLAWLERERGVRALLVGHESEQETLEEVRHTARRTGADPALWLGQDGGMPLLAGLLAAARLYFGNDTGALHLAAALGRPVLPIFGGGHWPRFRPVARRALPVVQPLPCFGCGWDCLYTDAPCVRTISPASVQQALTQFLDGDGENQAIFEAAGLDPGARALIETATPRLRFLRDDSRARLAQVRELTALLHASEADRADRWRQVERLGSQLHASEADRDARQSQVAELTALLRASDTDRGARQSQVEELTALLLQSETDRDARQGQIEELTALLRASEADRNARQGQIEELTALFHVSEADRADRQRQVEELTALFHVSEADRADRQRQVEELTALLAASEADRADRQSQIEELALRARALDRQVHANGDEHRRQIEELTALLRASEADREARLGQVEELTALLRVSEADRAARGRRLEALAAQGAGMQTAPGPSGESAALFSRT